MFPDGCRSECCCRFRRYCRFLPASLQDELSSRQLLALFSIYLHRALWQYFLVHCVSELRAVSVMYTRRLFLLVSMASAASIVVSLSASRASIWQFIGFLSRDNTAIFHVSNWYRCKCPMFSKLWESNKQASNGLLSSGKFISVHAPSSVILSNNIYIHWIE